MRAFFGVTNGILIVSGWGGAGALQLVSSEYCSRVPATGSGLKVCVRTDDSVLHYVHHRYLVILLSVNYYLA